jgi:alanine dehydrogenase
LRAESEQGCCQALRDDPHLRAGLNVCAGQLCNAQVAQALGLAAVAPESLL